ncbi:MAG: hypothetical protein ABEH78_08290 [Haloferacaceae archaeon]
MRPSLAVLVALLAVLAGCGAGPSATSPSGTDAQPSPTPTAAPTTPTPATTLDPTSVPGVRADGVNVTRLTAAHEAALNRTSYTLNVSVRRGDARRRIVVATSGPVPTRIRSESPSRTRVEYYEDGRFYRRTVAGGNVSYRMGPFVGNPAFSGASVLRQYMSMARYAPMRTTVHRGEPVVVLAADREDLRSGAFGDATTESFASRALVGADGVVRSFEFVASGTTADGRPFVVRVRLRVTGIGDTVVGAPDWLDEARAATSGTAGNETAGTT